jgi:hypothetical protein
MWSTINSSAGDGGCCSLEQGLAVKARKKAEQCREIKRVRVLADVSRTGGMSSLLPCARFSLVALVLT